MEGNISIGYHRTGYLPEIPGYAGIIMQPVNDQEKDRFLPCDITGMVMYHFHHLRQTRGLNIRSKSLQRWRHRYQPLVQRTQLAVMRIDGNYLHSGEKLLYHTPQKHGRLTLIRSDLHNSMPVRELYTGFQNSCHQQ